MKRTVCGSVAIFFFYLTSVFTAFRPPGANYGLVDFELVAGLAESFFALFPAHQRHLDSVQLWAHRVT